MPTFPTGAIRTRAGGEAGQEAMHEVRTTSFDTGRTMRLIHEEHAHTSSEYLITRYEIYAAS